MSGLSRKALRIYEENGLLLPVHIDPQSRYRWYGRDQLHTARVIQVMRAIDLPISAIQGLLNGPDPLLELQNLWRGVQQQHQQAHLLVDHLTDLLSGKGANMSFQVQERAFPAAFVATITGKVAQHEGPAFIGGSIQKIRAHLEKVGAQALEIDWTICHEGPTRDAPGIMEVCVPYTGHAVPTAEISLKHEPAHRAAFIRLRKEQARPSDLMQAHHAAQQWLQEHGHALVMGSREVYFADWVNTQDHEDAFDLAFPFEVLSEYL